MSETILLFPSVIIGAKVVLLLLAAISHHVGLKSPNPPPKEKDGVYRGQIFENIVRLLATASQVCQDNLNVNNNLKAEFAPL